MWFELNFFWNWRGPSFSDLLHVNLNVWTLSNIELTGALWPLLRRLASIILWKHVYNADSKVTTSESDDLELTVVFAWPSLLLLAVDYAKSWHDGRISGSLSDETISRFGPRLLQLWLDFMFSLILRPMFTALWFVKTRQGDLFAPMEPHTYHLHPHPFHLTPAPNHVHFFKFFLTGNPLLRYPSSPCTLHILTLLVISFNFLAFILLSQFAVFVW